VWACALGGESASVVGPGTGPGWQYDGMHAATCCNACDACNAWLHKERGPCNPDDALLSCPALPCPAITSHYIFSLLPPGTT
jgi:hypothetical protein